jgi:hypothetical protein
MGRINLITGTASGKIGQFQYQTHGMKCVVRTKQPEGLTNDQAELVNKPILLNLSSAYHQWAKYLLTEYPSDWAKPQALWNYYTKCNQALFEGTADYEAGFAVVKHGAVKQYRATYTVRPWEQTAEFQFDEAPAALDASAVVYLVHGLISGPPENWVIVPLSVTADPQAAPYWNEEAGSENIGFFLLDHAGKLYGGMTLCAVKGAAPPEYFSPSPEEIAANMLIFEEQSAALRNLQIRLAFNSAFMPSWITGKTIKYTAHVNLVGHPAGTSWTEVYSPATVYQLPRFDVYAPVDNLLSWVIVDGETEKSDVLSLKISELIPPQDLFTDSYATIYQEQYDPNSYYAVLWLVGGTEEQEEFLYNFYLKFTGQGSFTSHLPENPMFYRSEDFPYLWEEVPYVPVTPPCGTVQLVIGDHPNDSRYFFGPPFTVGYDEG